MNHRSLGTALAATPLAATLLAATLLAATSGCSSWFTSTRSEFVPASPDYLRERLSREPSTPDADADHYAVLIGANTDLRHRANISLAYQVLVEQGYRRDHIYILDSEGENPFFPLTDITTRESVQLLFTHLAQVIGPEDTLFVYVTGHEKADVDSADDDDQPEPSTLILNPGEELTQQEFSELLEKTHPEAGILFADQCFWAPFSMDKLCNFVIINTSHSEQAQHGTGFPRAFWSAFRDRRTSPAPLTIFDAFRFAMVADRATTLGLNKPRLAHGCVNPASITLLGLRPDLIDRTAPKPASSPEPPPPQQAAQP